MLERLGPAAWLGAVAAFMPLVMGFALIAYMPTIAEWLRSHGSGGVWVYAGGFALLAGLALMPTYAQSALGGYAFGVWAGVGAAMAGFFGGAAIGYFIARKASGDRVDRVVRENTKWQAVRRALLGEGRGFWKTTWMVALLRCPPNSPFAITNLVMASVKVPWGSFLVGTVVGMLPRTAVAVWIGHLVAERSQQFTKDAVKEAMPAWAFWGGIALGVVVLGVVMLIAQRAIERVTRQGATEGA